MQPYPRRQNSLRGEKKKQTSRRNLGVKWIVGSATFAAIAFIWQRLSGRPMLELFRATLSQRRRQRQLPFEDQSHGLAEWDRHARAEPGEAAWACYRGTVGLVARVHGPGGGSGRPRRRVATRVSILSGIEKKDDLRLIVRNRPPKSGPTYAVASRTEWPCAISCFFTFGDPSPLAHSGLPCSKDSFEYGSPSLRHWRQDTHLHSADEWGSQRHAPRPPTPHDHPRL